MIGTQKCESDAKASPEPFLANLFSEGCKCRNYVTKKCVPRQKRNCATQYREECRMVIGEKCGFEPRKHCEMKYKKQCEYEKKMHCETTYIEECQPTYNYEKMCKKKPQQSCQYINGGFQLLDFIITELKSHMTS